MTTTKKSTTKKSAGKTPAKTKAATSKRLSALEAAAKVLAQSAEPLNTRELIEAMASKGYWKSPGGQTPHATLYAAILRDMSVKGTDSRFQKTERGRFTVKR